MVLLFKSIITTFCLKILSYTGCSILIYKIVHLRHLKVSQGVFFSVFRGQYNLAQLLFVCTRDMKVTTIFFKYNYVIFYYKSNITKVLTYLHLK